MFVKDITFYIKTDVPFCTYMSKYRTIFFLIFFLVYSPIKGSSQNEKNFKPMGIPEVFIMPSPGSDNESIMGVIPGSLWQIYSDIDENLVYSGSDGLIPINRVKFLTAFLVGNEKNGFLQVYNCPKSPGTGFFLTNSAIQIGWIKKSSAILWSHCLLDSITGSELHLLTYSTSGPLKLIENEKYQDGVDLFLDPSLTKKTGRKTSSNQLYFVYKITAKSVLIGNDRRISGNDNPNQIILGWIPVNYCFFLSNRIWLAPNDNSEAIEERNKKGISPTLFIDEEHARQYSENNPVQTRFILWNDQRNAAYPPELFRFPVISEKNHILKVTIVDDDFKNAFTSEKASGLNYPVFKKVTLISNYDLNNVLSNMNRLIEAYNSPEPRTNVHRVITKLLSDDFQNIEEEFVNNMTFKEIFKKLFWICDQQSPLLTYKLRRIEDRTILTDKILKDFFADLKGKETHLSLISVKDYDQLSFISNNNRYFWIDISFFL